MNTEQTLEDLLEQGTVGELREAHHAIVARIKDLEMVESINAKRKTKVGDIFVLSNIRPKYMNGQKVRVTDIQRTKAHVEAIEGPAAGEKYVVPFTCLVSEAG